VTHRRRVLEALRRTGVPRPRRPDGGL